MYKEQKGGCKICGEHPEFSRLHVDHCHETGKVRSLLCNACNITLGLVKESKITLRKMIEYLEEHSK